MCSDDDRVEDGGERTTSRVEKAIAHVLIGTDETMVSGDGKSLSDPSRLP